MSFFSTEPPEPEVPVCPKCGQETDTFYLNVENEIVGCFECIKRVDAGEVA